MGREKNKPKCHLPRRQFLGMLGASAAVTFPGPLQMLISSLIDGMTMSAQAQVTGAIVKPRNFIYVNLPGGPPRWVWDMPLMPYRTEAIIANPHVATRFTSSTQSGYVTNAITRAGVTLNMPSLWNQNIPTVGGGQAPMANLLENMLMIRGVKLPSDGHTNNNFKTLRPLNSSPSLHGAVADRSQAPVPAVNLPGGFSDAYKSRKGVAQGKLNDFANDPLRRLLSPFDRSSDALDAGVLSRQNALDISVNAALRDLAAQAKSNMPGTESLYAMRNDAETLLRRGIGDLSTAYTGIRDKYANLIRAVGAGGMDGVTNVPVAVGNLPRPNGFVINHTINADQNFLGPAANLGQMITANSNVANLAEGFAVAEYLLINGYSSSINLAASYISGLSFQDVFEPTKDAAGRVTGARAIGNQVNGWAHDEHSGGSFCSLIINSFHFKAIAACLYEMVSVLKTANIFKETVIQVGGEFSRDPRNDNSGSDHGWMAHATSLVSGAIIKPMVLGHTLFEGANSPAGGNYRGTWGAAAPVKVDGIEQELTIGHATSTVAELLRVEHPMSNNGALIQETTGGITNLVDLAINK
ncbi:MAG: hypothetical protein SGJ18_03865 [Pseudomonadota bacterium]|nr:hypothetical protein [Pseudomonadota bacterium]